MDGFTPLQINLEGDNAWPELDGAFEGGTLTHLAVLPSGTSGGRPAIMLRGKLDNGDEVVLQTTWNLLYTACLAVRARYGEAT